jgi:hypothetical protein
MRHLLICFVLLCFIISVPVSSALAEREVNIKQAEPAPTVIFMGDLEATQACVTGNPNPPAWAISGWMLPPEEYRLAFDPILHGDCAAECAPLPGKGFNVNTVSIHIQVAAACTIIMSVNVSEVIYPTSPDCPEPGPLACSSPLYQVDLASAGGWMINLPVDCVCLTFNREYMLGIYFDSATCTPDLVTDNFPSNCTSWNNYGSGWVDLVAGPGFPGNLRITADASCCEPPVPVESKSWGVIKTLYSE